MLELPETVTLFNLERATEVRAKLVRLTREIAAEMDGTWWQIEVSKNLRAEEGDHHWKWRKLVGDRRNHSDWDALAVQSRGGFVEGAVSYRIDAKSQLSPGDGAVYVDRIATAPRNRPWLVEQAKYRGVGKILLLAAVRHSYLLGLEGRVWLTSLPSERTREFYRNRGFDVIFANPDGMIDYELSSAAAEEWLQEEGYL